MIHSGPGTSHRVPRLPLMEVAMLNIETVHHVSLPASDLVRSTKFYEGVLVSSRWIVRSSILTVKVVQGR